ncbi:patatin-like phospholipase family protein [Streptomyces sp. NPDC048172]|uniref:patatin-like phospholipase family protein n=1 Tax=Streptomyces sp. NPDC048172 TaxID=3365505 RepID=UPI003712F73B
MTDTPSPVPRALSEVAKSIPLVTDEELLTLVNCLTVSSDLTRFRRDDGFFRTFFTRALGLDAQPLLNQNVVETQRILTNRIEELTAQGVASNLALARAGDVVTEIRQDLSALGQAQDARFQTLDASLVKLHTLCVEQQLRCDAERHLDQLIDAWSAKETYRGLPWALQIVLLVQEIYRGAVGEHEFRTGGETYRPRIVNKILIGPRTQLPLLALLHEEVLAPCLRLDPPDRPVLAELVRPFALLTEAERREHPLPFAVGRCVTLAAASPGAPDSVERAVAEARHHQPRLSLTMHPRVFVQQVVAATAAANIAVREALHSGPAEPAPGSAPASAPALHGAVPVPRTEPSGPSVREESAPPDVTTAPDAPLPGPSWGLVLAGGGAKGAYQVGVVERLAEAGLRPSALAGTSIGALNAAVLAAAPDLAEGASRLREVWRDIGERTSDAFPDDVARLSVPDSAESPPPGLLELLQRRRSPILRSDFIEGLLDEWVDPEALLSGPDLWVAAFPSATGWRGLGWLVDLSRSAAGAEAEWFHVQRMRGDDVHGALLASAALPGVFAPQQVAGRPYRDGALADNVPLRPLATETGCTGAVVVHLGNGLVWDGAAYPDCVPLEIRPTENIVEHPRHRLGSIGALLDFSPRRIEELRARGYADASALITEVHGLLERAHALRESGDRATEAIDRAEGTDRPASE